MFGLFLLFDLDSHEMTCLGCGYHSDVCFVFACRNWFVSKLLCCACMIEMTS